MVDAAFQHFNHIDVIMNYAGYALIGAAEVLTDAQIVHQLDTNWWAPLRWSRAALPHLRSQGGGRILQMSSVGGQIAIPGMSLYHVSKWASKVF